MQSQIKILFLVVLYEKNLTTSETLSSIALHQDLLSNVHLFIWDNSPNPQIQEHQFKEFLPQIKTINYHSNSENTALSKIYNHVIASQSNNYDYITLLDHDSLLAQNVILELLEIASLKTYDLILPKIIDNNNIVSPAKLFYFKGSYFSQIKTNVIAAKYITAINSGMTIKTSFFSETGFRYDEKLNFYGTDDDFMKFYCQKRSEVYVLSSQINHTLNYYSDEPVSKKLWRFKQIMFGILYLNGDSFFLKIATSIYVFLYSIKQSFKNKSIKFIYFGWKNGRQK